MLCNMFIQTTALILAYVEVALNSFSQYSVEQDTDFTEQWNERLRVKAPFYNMTDNSVQLFFWSVIQ